MSLPFYERLGNWLDRRLDFKAWQAFAVKKLVPAHRQSVWYYLGGIALIMLVMQVLTGLLLMVYYVPEISSAHASILHINSQVDFGWFVRSFHSWGANLLVLALFIHMFSTYFMKAYRPPRELTWLSGLVLLVIAFGFGFTGYLLPWDEVSYFATLIGVDIVSKTPLIGEGLATLLRGGDEVGQDTLLRFYAIHVMLLPLISLPFLGLHLWLVQAHGMSEPESVQAQPPNKRRYEKFFPTFLLKDMMVWILVVNLLAILVALFPWGIGPEAEPFAPAPIGIRPEWYFLAMFQVLRILPPHVGPIEGEQFGMILIGLAALMFVLIPFIDQGSTDSRSRRISRWATIFGGIFLVLFVVFTLWGWVA